MGYLHFSLTHVWDGYKAISNSSKGSASPMHSCRCHHIPDRKIPFVPQFQSSQWWEGMWEFMFTSWRDRKLRHAATCNSPTLVIYFKQCDSASSHLRHSHFPDRARNMSPWGISHYSNHSTALNNDQEVSIMIISKEMPPPFFLFSKSCIGFTVWRKWYQTQQWMLEEHSEHFDDRQASRLSVLSSKIADS